MNLNYLLYTKGYIPEFYESDNGDTFTYIGNKNPYMRASKINIFIPYKKEEEFDISDLKPKITFNCLIGQPIQPIEFNSLFEMIEFINKNFEYNKPSPKFIINPNIVNELHYNRK